MKQKLGKECTAFTGRVHTAGAESLVISMWSVPGLETKELMIEFYKKIQSGKFNRCQALRQADLKQMSITKGRYRNSNPLYGGTFVFLGEPN